MELEQIYATYFRDVYLYICKLYNSEHIAEEITSETFFKPIVDNTAPVGISYGSGAIFRG